MKDYSYSIPAPVQPTAVNYIAVLSHNGQPVVCIRGDGEIELHNIDASDAARKFWEFVRANVREDVIHKMAFAAGVASVKGPLIS
jgi:hypothetical protein